jgi:ubiquinone/menaquinone biosynthesis C-methylase UbiE
MLYSIIFLIRINLRFFFGAQQPGSFHFLKFNLKTKFSDIMDNKEYYNKIGTYYDMDACDYDARYWINPVVQEMRQSFREEVKRFTANTMLEIGCGTGLDLVHFGKIHPGRKIYGIDVSKEMVRLSNERILASGCKNINIYQGSVDEISKLFPNQQFDLIYVFFGALNTVENLNYSAQQLMRVLNPGGGIVFSYVNKWYLGGMFIEIFRLRFARAFARLKTQWGGYSPTHYLPSHCYTPRQVKNAFTGLKVLRKKGYSITHPAWFYTKINQKLGKFRKIFLWIDHKLDKSFLWRFGEYGLLVFKH